MEKVECQLHLWYEKYRRSTFKTRSIPLDPTFVQYLTEDGIREDALTTTSTSSSMSGASVASSSSAGVAVRPAFPELEEAVSEAIAQFNGAVFPKLNWSSPKDANWMITGGQLKCDSFDDVVLVLKSSDFIVHDLCHAFDDFDTKPEVEYVLNLRRWHDLNPGSEFRCFWNNGILNISQRHTSQFFEYLQNEAARAFLLEHIREFIASLDGVIGPTVIDVYLDPPPKRRVWIVDFAPWCESTDPLLFDWEELKNRVVENVAGEFRVIECEGRCRQPVDRFNKMPQEVAQITGYSNDELMELVENLEKKGF
eukprot:GEMP01037543.1.p1 GENE.GEMP01037543.1~~GEMP01037543.1.p1  ORF type:complete len:317 (+),score=61.74 GEMP01037543.1:24-953(+)